MRRGLLVVVTVLLPRAGHAEDGTVGALTLGGSYAIGRNLNPVVGPVRAAYVSTIELAGAATLRDREARNTGVTFGALLGARVAHDEATPSDALVGGFIRYQHHGVYGGIGTRHGLARDGGRSTHMISLEAGLSLLVDDFALGLGFQLDLGQSRHDRFVALASTVISVDRYLTWF